MATSPIYSWPEPDNTDLVKNGALAIRTLGNAIDTTMGTMVAKTVVDAKGDLIAGTAADTVNRLAVGNNGETLVADSSTSTGLRYQATQAAGKNYLINGGQDIWQRGTTFSSAQYTSDRWFITSSSGTLVGSRSTDVPTSPYFQYSYSMAGTSAQNVQIYQNIESANSTLFAGQSVTLSVWAKNSAGTTKLSYVGLYPTAVDNFTSTTTDVSGDLTATSWSGSWTKYSVTFTANALATRGYKIILYRNGTETSTTLLTGIQLEIGSVATAFTRAGGTIQGELAACQRYYQRFNDAATSATSYANGQASSTTAAYFILNLLTTMRVKPTTLDVNLIRATDYNTGFTPSGSFSIYSGGTSPEKVALTASTFTGLTQYRAYVLESAGSTAAYIGIGAEL